MCPDDQERADRPPMDEVEVPGADPTPEVRAELVEREPVDDARSVQGHDPIRERAGGWIALETHECVVVGGGGSPTIVKVQLAVSPVASVTSKVGVFTPMG